MIDIAGNIKLSFGAKYMAEDTASYILYKFNRSALDGRAVLFERFCESLGLAIRCEYLSGDCTELLGIVAFEPQRIYTENGYFDCDMPTAFIERDIIERGESGLYNFTLALMCSQFLFYYIKSDKSDDLQLSFGLDSVASQNNKEIILKDAFLKIAADEDGPESFALKLALPKNGFKRQTAELFSTFGINRATLDSEKHLPYILGELANRYNVPEVAALLRLKQLNFY